MRLAGVVLLLRRALTGRRLTSQRRLVTLLAWLMLFPNCGPLPQISHTRAMTCAPELISCSNQKLFREAHCRRDENLIRKIQSIRELVEEGKAGGAAAYIPLLRSL